MQPPLSLTAFSCTSLTPSQVKQPSAAATVSGVVRQGDHRPKAWRSAPLPMRMAAAVGHQSSWAPSPGRYEVRDSSGRCR